ncbi:MAG: hypothetical protein F2825_00225 [Actinobacteria bacterium]|uniref:Unannotated protein n=1 Tax=freshwater metagenome TaxID=449393 RepID=A0A6J7FLV1_9ZZZZ|nr:hypothetical protein [Actinomycetota bacterium]
MIGQVLPRGSSVRGLLYYLFTEGQAGEKGLESAHSDPRVIASWDGAPQQLQPPVCGGKRDFAALTGRLTEPLLALEMTAAELKKAKPVFHLTVAAAKDPDTGDLVDRYLTDEQWADIAGEYMHRLGLARRGDEQQAVRWVAIRHADDHVHIVATLARQDGRRPRLSNDRYRSREASRFIEDKYGLRVTSAASRTGRPPTSRAEGRKHATTAARRRAAGRPAPAAPDREVLRRQVRVAAAGATSLPDFLARLRADGLLVRERFSTVNAGDITGYAVALPDKYDGVGKPIFFGGGKLAPDLTLPKLQRRWRLIASPDGPSTDRGWSTAPPGCAGSSSATRDPRQASDGRTDRFGLTAAERLRIWEQASEAAAAAAEQIAASVAADPAAAADAAWAASDFLAAAGRVVEGRRGGPLTTAAEQYDQAARELFGGLPQPTAAGHGLRSAGRLLLAARVAKPSENAQLLRLLAQLAALADAVTRLRETQQRAAQAAAARAAAEQLHAAVRRHQDGGVLGGAQPLASARRGSAQRVFTATAATPATGRR